jgi:hypothetical protein
MSENDAPPLDDEDQMALPPIPLGIVVARILIVSGIGFAAAFAIFFLVGGIWLLAGISVAVTAVFLFLMFAVERLAS